MGLKNFILNYLFFYCSYGSVIKLQEKLMVVVVSKAAHWDGDERIATLWQAQDKLHDDAMKC
jgi:hypothetical protein